MNTAQQAIKPIPEYDPNIKRIIPCLAVPKDVLQTYWQQLYMHGGLDTRLSDVKDPTWSDVCAVIAKKGNQMYCIFKGNEIIGEFQLDNFCGRAAQVHFSMHPQWTLGTTLRFGKWASDTVLQWKIDDRYIFESLFGLTSVANRAACIWTLKVGFKKLGLLPGGVVDRGLVRDAMVSVKTRGK